MKIGILGTGAVGQSLGEGFAKLGYAVKMGSRDPNKKEVQEWVSKNKNASSGTFAEAAAFGDIIVIATHWEKGATENAIRLAGKENFSRKIVIDVTNPLDFSESIPKMDVTYPDSAGLLIQKWLPDAKVVKAFNIITAKYMTNPNLEEGKPDLFIAGNDENAKKTVTVIAEKFGWEHVHDIGGIEQTYLLEALAMLWIRYGFLNNYWQHAFKLLKR